jgi:DNA-binding beta-propeller fold protein YncE
VSNNGFVYVCDRANNRIQVFTRDGEFRKEFVFDAATRENGSVWAVALPPDRAQQYLVYADGENNVVRVVDRESGKVLSSFGRSGRNAGQFHWVHQIAIDSKGNVYTGEVDTAKRLQKFVPISQK